MDLIEVGFIAKRNKFILLGTDVFPMINSNEWKKVSVSVSTILRIIRNDHKESVTWFES